MRFEYKGVAFDIKGVSEDDHVYQEIVRAKSFYELDLLEYVYRLRRELRATDGKNVVIDIGANIGNHSIFLRSFLADTLIAIEPNAKVVPVLRRNLAKNVADYAVFDCAVGEREGRGTIMIPDGMENNAGAAGIEFSDDTGGVVVSTLDLVMADWEKEHGAAVRLPLLKIDVEGMELDVLKGATDTLRDHRPHILVEALTDTDVETINQFLRPLGYRKLPGRWGFSPVHHFAYKPRIALYLRVWLILIRRFVAAKMHRFKRS